MNARVDPGRGYYTVSGKAVVQPTTQHGGPRSAAPAQQIVPRVIARARRRTASPQAGAVAPPSTTRAPEFHELARMRRFVFDALSWLGGIRQPARLPRSSPVRPSPAAATGTHINSLHRRRAPAQRPHARASEPNGARLAVRSGAVNVTGMDCLPINVARNRSSLCA
jgi:hypothetical protein